MRKKASAWMAVGIGMLMVAGLARGQDWDTGVNAGLSLTDGNSETLNLNVGVTAEQGDEENNLKLGAAYNYGETESDTTVDNAQALAEYRKVLSGDTYGYAAASFLNDDIAGIDYRFLVGPGLGQYLVRNDLTTLGAEVGAAWVIEDAGDSNDYVALRLAQNLEHQLSETAKLFESIEYLPEFEDFDNYLINGQIGIEAEINADLSLRVVFQDRYDSTPAPGKDENDLSLIAGFGYTL